MLTSPYIEIWVTQNDPVEEQEDEISDTEAEFENPDLDLQSQLINLAISAARQVDFILV